MAPNKQIENIQLGSG